ncbi:DUF402 domain-containing protein [Paenibacillus sp. OAS669]|uniref:DUF402 domain-containing protein n=1 Tax=Paenibacillus sp. OAS669 TaxID=2663821 RepID=UPI001789954F|nr:DUF402 domain-containing protein [Paenibacillus sp. OAS669]MBE1441613.1 hypothetical protein [Paenibacillus sp. OAS669]
MDKEYITIQSRKYGNRLHYEWKARPLEKTDKHIFVLSEPGRELHHYTRGKIFICQHWTIEYFSFASWFTVSADVVDGSITQYYCNINQPATWDGNTVTYVDLDLDYVRRNNVWKVIDEDEFASNAVELAYPPELVERAKLELESLQQRVANGQFPFDGTIEKYVQAIPKGTQ